MRGEQPRGLFVAEPLVGNHLHDALVAVHTSGEGADGAPVTHPCRSVDSRGHIPLDVGVGGPQRPGLRMQERRVDGGGRSRCV